jgi:hypothetical protein
MITAKLFSTLCLSSCINGGEEPHTAILTGGRHPGQYFLTGGETMDILMGDKVITILLTGGVTKDIGHPHGGQFEHQFFSQPLMIANSIQDTMFS